MYARSRWFGLILIVFGSCQQAFVWGQSTAAETDFGLARGFSLEPVASDPLTKWPTLVDWDFDGNLLVVESGGVAHPIQEHNRQLLHRVVRLIDLNGDGKMDQRQLVADQLPFTEGILCLGSRILVTSPPVIYELIDSDGDGFCEQRGVWFDGQTITGCANDLHGPYLGRDGWVYWTKGAFAQQTHQTLDGGTLSDKAAHIYRRKISGGPIDPLMSGGMDNPVGFTMLPNGERFFSSTFLVHPGDGRRDGVVHAIYGGAYGKDHAALDGVVRTGTLMPIMAHLGPAAPSGLKYLQSDLLGQDGDDLLVAALFNHRKVIALPISPHQATYRAEPVDLVTGHRIDFHPTDILEDADGSLLVIDTGGWYDLCCPSSRVDQQLAAGGIYRLTNIHQEKPDLRPRRIKLADDATSAEIVDLLNDPRPWVARQALLRIASSGDWAVKELSHRAADSRLSLATRRSSLWALGAIGSASALQSVHELLRDKPAEPSIPSIPGRSHEEREMQHIACHLVSLHGYGPAKQDLERILLQLSIVGQEDSSSNLALARVAAEALGRVGDADSVEALFKSFDNVRGDRILDHSIRYALYEIGSADAVAEYLDSSSGSHRELALSTLDLLQAEPWLTGDSLVEAALDSATYDTALRLIIQRPQLAATILNQSGPQWAKSMLQEPPAGLFQQLCKAWINSPEMDHWIAEAVSQMLASSFQAGDSVNASLWQWIDCILKARSGRPVPAQWHGWIVELLNREPSRLASSILEVDLSPSEQAPLVRALSEKIASVSDSEVKLALLMCLPARHLYTDDQWATEQIQILRGLLEGNPDQSSKSNDKRTVWNALQRLYISDGNARELLRLIPQLSSSDLLMAIEVIASAEREDLDRQMLLELAKIRAARGLPSGSLVSVYRRRPDALRSLAEQVSLDLARTDPDVQAQVQTVLKSLPAGDAVRGLSLYHSTKVNCGGCHQMGYLGGKIGPELTRIGASRTREALLEAILYPNQRIEQGFQSTQVLTVDGRVVHGIPTAKSSESLIELRVSADRVESIPQAEVEEIKPSDISIMPGGMAELLSPQELSDLLSLLEAAR
jgi:putative heme-binding domain-containing protein